MKRMLSVCALSLCGAILCGGEAIPNWTAPPAWSSAKSHSGVAVMDVTPPLPFIGLTPCRIADTRGNGFTGPYGPPSLAANANRSFTITGQCGIPAGAAAVSFNFTALNVGAAGDLRVFPAGGGAPLVSTLNYNGSTPNIANAALTPLGSGGAITVLADATGIDLIIDVNGYYASAAANQGNTFKVVNNGGDFVPAIWGQTNSTGGDAAGVLGTATAATGQNFGVDGQNLSSTDGSSGVRGFAFATSGRTSGVQGRNISQSRRSSGVFGNTSQELSQDTAGVRGTTNEGVFSGQTYASAGVRGESAPGYGVLGISNTSGVGAALLGNSNEQLVYALLAAKGPTNYAVFAGGDFGGIGAKYFVDPHPMDASRVIRYVSLEGPEAGTYFRGRGKFQNGLATIEVPEDFRMVTDVEGLSVQVTPIGEFANVAVVRIELDGILVKASRNVEFFYTVNGVRKTHKDLKPIGLGNEFMPRNADERMPAYLTEGQKAMLVSNGTYREDGAVNLETAKRLGWDRIWEDRNRARDPR